MVVVLVVPVAYGAHAITSSVHSLPGLDGGTQWQPPAAELPPAHSLADRYQCPTAGIHQ